MEEEICLICGTELCDHDFQHLARYCYPAQIKALQAQLAAAEKIVEEARVIRYWWWAYKLDAALTEFDKVKEE